MEKSPSVENYSSNRKQPKFLMASLKAITHRRQKIWRYRLMANLKGANVSHISPHCRLNLLLDVFVQKRQNLFIGSNSSM